MKHTIQFETGATTCAIEPGKFCRWVARTYFGTEWVCTLFSEGRKNHVYLEDRNGWLQRAPQCLEAFPAEDTKAETP